VMNKLSIEGEMGIIYLLVGAGRMGRERGGAGPSLIRRSVDSCGGLDRSG
jgi:hypothetical protein